jgi:hypothetical protein
VAARAYTWLMRSIWARALAWRWWRISITLVEMKTMVPTTAATGKAMWRYAIVMLGWSPRRRAAITIPTMPSSRLTANDSRVRRNVISKIRAGITYQWGWLAGLLLGGISVDCNAARAADLRLRPSD